MPDFPPRAVHAFVGFALLILATGCGVRGDKGPVRVDVIGTEAQAAKPLDNGGNAVGQSFLAATAQGLVAFDAGGALVGGLAERWVVEEDGQSYLFRLKHARWKDGGQIKAAEVASSLRERFRAYPAIVAGLDPQARGMTDDVLEIRLSGPMPSFLQLLAHPAMAITRRGAGTGPFHSDAAREIRTLVALPPSDPADEGEAGRDASPPRTFFMRPVRAALGFARFERNYTDLLLGGRFQHLPFIGVADLPSGAVRLDPVNGLLGLMIEGDAEFLANRDVREALSSAIDRDRLTQGFGQANWRSATNLIPAPLDLRRPPAQPSWAANDLAARRGFARSVVKGWAARNGGTTPVLSIALPPGPGARALFDALRQDYEAIGLSTKLVAWDAPADLRLIDEVAPFDSAIWYLARLGCRANRLCDDQVDGLLDTARSANTDQALADALIQAEARALAVANYIPLAMPVRFALVRARLTGYQLSPRARHPLNALFRTPK